MSNEYSYTLVNEIVGHNMPESGIRISWDPDALTNAGPICALHYHDEAELLLVCSGRMSLVVDGEEYTASEGQVLYAGPRVPHYTVALSDGLNYVLLQARLAVIASDEPAAMLIGRAADGVVSAAVIDDELIAREIRTLADEHANKEDGYEYMVRASVCRVVGLMIRDGYIISGKSENDTSALERLSPALDYINKNYQLPLKLEDISALMKLNPSYFCRIFKSATGVTFTEYLNAVRVQKSERMLRKSTKSITEISNDVGFATVTYYNRMFKKYMKCTPSAYRMIKYGNI